MAIEEAAVRQSTSPEQSGFETSPGNDIEERAREKGAESALADRESVGQIVSSLSKAIENLSTGKKSEPSTFKRFLLHPLVIVLVGGLVSALIGGGVTYFYTSEQKKLDHERNIQQQNLASHRSFSDELNKIRIQKFGEVWEQIDKNEVIIDDLLEKANKPAISVGQKNENVAAIKRLLQEDEVVINKNRFWLGEHYYNEIGAHLSKNIDLALAILINPQMTNLSELLEERALEKQYMHKIREDMRLEGEPRK